MILKGLLSSIVTKSMYCALVVSMGVVSMVFSASDAHAGPLDDMVTKIVTSLGNGPLLFAIVCYLFGSLLIVSSIFKMRVYIESPSNEPLKGPLARFFGGGAVMSAPTIIEAMRDLLDSGSSGTQRELPSGGSAGLGQLIDNVTLSFQQPEAFFALIAYFFGMGFAIWAILEFIKSAENSNQVPLRRPIMITLTASALLALPDVLSAVRDTFMLGFGNVTGQDVTAPGSSGGDALDQLLYGFTTSIYGPMLDLFGHISWISGVAFGLSGIFRLLKNAQDGAKSPVGMGTLGTFATAAVLMSVPAFMGVAQESIFGSTQVKTYAVLASNAGNADMINRANQAILAVFLFVRIVGWFSFIRGIFILRSYAEGTGQASMAAGFTHIIGGAIAVNLASFVKAVQSTLGLTGLVIN